MSDDLEGWELHTTQEYEVWNQGINGKERVTSKTYIKKINGEWYYKVVKDVTFIPRIEFKPIDGKGEYMYDYYEENKKVKK